MMIEKIGSAAMLEQLAEESSELTKAALKLARKLREENPTPVSGRDAIANLIEEWTDVNMCADELELFIDKDQRKAKQERFEKRWKEAHEHKTEKSYIDRVIKDFFMGDCEE